LITIENLNSKEKYQKEYKEKFNWELYSFPIENKHTDSVVIFNLNFKKVNLPCELLEKIDFVLKTNYRFKMNGSFKEIKSIHYSLVTSSTESKEVMQVYIIKMKTKKGANDLFGLFNQKIFGKDAQALQKGKSIVISTGKTCLNISSQFFSTLSKKMIFRKLSPSSN
jgi:hypothetical protein